MSITYTITFHCQRCHTSIERKLMPEEDTRALPGKWSRVRAPAITDDDLHLCGDCSKELHEWFRHAAR